MALSFVIKVKLSTFLCIFICKIMSGTAHASCVWPLWSLDPKVAAPGSVDYPLSTADQNAWAGDSEYNKQALNDGLNSDLK